MNEPVTAPPATAPAAPVAPAVAPSQTAPASTAPEGTQDASQVTPATEPKADPFHKAHAELAKKEKALLERTKSLSATEKRTKQIEAALQNPDRMAALEDLGAIFGVNVNLFEEAAKAAVTRKKVDPVAAKAVSEVEAMRRELTVRDVLPLIAQGHSFEEIAKAANMEPEAFYALANDPKNAPRFQAAQQEHTKQIETTLAHHDQTARAWVTAQTDTDGTPRYELIAKTGAESAVFQLIVTHFEETLADGNPVQLTTEQAADIIESHLLERAKLFIGAKKLQPLLATQQPIPPAPATRLMLSSTKTLANVTAQESASSTRVHSTDPERERMAAAEKKLEAIVSAKVKK